MTESFGFNIGGYFSKSFGSRPILFLVCYQVDAVREAANSLICDLASIATAIATLKAIPQPSMHGEQLRVRWTMTSLKASLKTALKTSKN